MNVWPGKPYPLGATWDGAGVNFALFSENATAVELCLFHIADPDYETARIRFQSTPTRSGTPTCRTSAPVSSTGIACTVPTNPARGHRFNPAKLLLDPYAQGASPAMIALRADALYGYM